MKRKETVYLTHFFPTLVFLLLIFLSAYLTLFGIRFFQKTNQKSRAGFQTETIDAYLRQKVRSHDSKNEVQIISFGDSDALQLSDEVNGSSYRTILYLYQGKLMEMYAGSGANLSPQAGNEIAELSSWKMRMEKNRLLCCELKDDKGWSRTIYIPARTGGEGR